MFNNIGSKVKGLAIFVVIAGCIVSLFSAITIWSTNNYNGVMTVPGILTLLGGCVGSWIGSWVMYAIGEIAEQAAANAYMLSTLQGKLEKMSKGSAETVASQSSSPVSHTSPKQTYNPVYTGGPKKMCRKCGAMNNTANSTCFACGENLE